MRDSNDVASRAFARCEQCCIEGEAGAGRKDHAAHWRILQAMPRIEAAHSGKQWSSVRITNGEEVQFDKQYTYQSLHISFLRHDVICRWTGIQCDDRTKRIGHVYVSGSAQKTLQCDRSAERGIVRTFVGLSRSNRVYAVRICRVL